ncbi:putative secreted RxLR effector protein [Phytophthora cinnamomi]|uniref:putative secreted RxLR effector protein n=1 Tax=Phytophthora cinnamomi TaxID=4785 RepID=UPI00355A5961|nr:putative secreted RxLR effector protein [Phytophthora cinnamomi]
MRTCRALLVAAFILVTIIDPLAAANRAEIQSLSIKHVNTNNGRLLRGTATDVDLEAEDRDFISVVKSLAADAKMSWKTSRWANSGKTDKQVREKLGLVGLKGKALENSPNYKHYKDYLYKAEGVEMNRWLYAKTQTETVWNNLKLEEMTPAQRERSDALRRYKRYALKFDHYVKTSSYFERSVSHNQNSDAEMAVKIQLWVEKRQSRFFVEHVLGLEGMTEDGRAVMETNKYYEEFLTKREEAKLHRRNK